MLPSLLAELEASGALLEGHFRLSSGLHSNRYIQCAKLLEEPGRAQRVGHALADTPLTVTPLRKGHSR